MAPSGFTIRGLLFSVLAVCLLAGCDVRGAESKVAKVKAEPPAPPPWRFLETGDLDRLRARGKLRILMPEKMQADHLPRHGLPIDAERKLAVKFAKSIGLKPVFVYVERRDDLIPWLLKGRGDIVAAGLTATESRRSTVNFTVPLSIVREQVVVHRDNREIQTLEDLSGKTIAQRPSSSYWETLTKLKESLPDLRLEPAPETLETEQMIYEVARRKREIVVADSDIVDSILPYLPEIRVAFELSGDQGVGWAVRPANEKLLEELNGFLSTEQLATRRTEPRPYTWEEIKKRKVIRVITRNSASTYFIWRGKLLGFEYELASKFAERYGLRLEVVVAPGRDDLLPYLLEGKGDFIAAALTITENRKKWGVAFSDAYNKVSEIVVARANDTDLNDVKDLEGRTLVVRKSSSYMDSLNRLKAKGTSFTVIHAPEDMESEEIIAGVADGTYDLTVVDSHILDIELTWRDDIRAAFSLGPPVSHGWVVRADDPEILAAVNDTFRRLHKGAFYNGIYKKYFENSRRIRKHIRFQAKRVGQLSPYDDIAEKYSRRYGFDWRLIVSQMYQESHFDPDAVSFSGALGLMQVLPRTGRQMGFQHLTHPDSGIHAGVKYMSWLHGKFPDDLSVKDRMWFTLASYNAGYGHVLDARRLAEQMGWNPNRWYDHVEKAMLLLSRPKYARLARYGYCRGREPVRYVREIDQRFRAYVKVVKP